MSIGTGQIPARVTDSDSLTDVLRHLKALNPVYSYIPLVDQYFVDRSWLYPAANFLQEALYDIYNPSLLVVISVDEQSVPAFVAGTCYKGTWNDNDQMFCLIHGSIPGPFPCTLGHRLDGLPPVRLENDCEALVWLVSHEFCHFLKRSGQLQGPNDERSANLFADEQLAKFRVVSEMQGLKAYTDGEGLSTV